jgi:phosphatidylethanolamine/phosphatidyl-N-methylethanolamine N-methyltransferase
LDIDAIQKAYRRYARFYDLYFGMLFHRGRKAVINGMDCRTGEKILEVGVGTGLSLPLYPKDVNVTGIDISPEMLEKARARRTRDALDHVSDLRVMDAESMQFPDNHFDKVVAMYVVPVVTSPANLVEEMRRVCKPKGEIFIVNHFQSSNPMIGRLEQLLAPYAEFLGFHPDLRFDTFIQETGLDVIERSGVNLFGYWTMLRARNTKQQIAEEPVSIQQEVRLVRSG